MSYFNDKKVGDPKWIAGDEEHDAALAESGVAVEAACRFRALATHWLVQDVVPHEAVTVIAGAAGAGKTFFACQLAADAARQCRYRVVVATSGYERPELLRWRLDQAQGDARRIVFARLTPPKGIKDRRPAPTEEEITERLAILYHTIEGAADPESGMLPEMPVVSSSSSVATSDGQRTTDDRVRLLVIDDVDGWFGTPGNMLSAAALARVIQRLNELAIEKQVAVVVLARVQLSVEGRITARQLSRIAHAASVVWMLAESKEGSDDQEDASDRSPKTQDLRPKHSKSNPKSCRWLMPVKNNLAEQGAVPGLAFELVEGRIRWRKFQTVPELAEVLLPSVHNTDRRRLRRAACEWLKEALADGPMPSGEVIKQALSCGISKGTLTRAITDLGIKSHKTGFNGGWEMRWTPRAERRVEPPLTWTGGLRIVGAEELRDGETGEGERERGDKETRGRTAGQGDKETRGQGEEWKTSVGADRPHPSPLPVGEGAEESCASSEKREDFAMVSCASSEEWKTAVGADRPHPSPLAEGEGAEESCDSTECKMQIAKCPGTPGQNDARGSWLHSQDLSPKTQALSPKTQALRPKT